MNQIFDVELQKNNAMKKMTLKQFMKWQLLAVVVLFAVLHNLQRQIEHWYFSKSSITYDFENFIFIIILYLQLIIILCATFFIIRWLNKVMSWSKNTLLRAIIEIIILTIITNTFLLAFEQIYLYFKVGAFFQLKDIIHLSMNGTMINFFLIPIVELTLIHHSKLQTDLYTKELQIKNAKFEYELLKNQIDPHFLFNSLSVLNSLINIDKNRAKKFTNSFSNVLRHVLDYKNIDTISLKEEKYFLEQYIYLMKTRFDESLHVNLVFLDKHLKHKILPMVTQLLIENVIKHNEISDIHPMTINISSTEEGVIISNKKQLKTSTPSWGIGLENIKNRYANVGQTIQIMKDEDNFNVLIPYI